MVVPIVIGGGAAWFGISQIDEIFSTVESGIETGVEVGISTSIPGPTAPPFPRLRPRRVLSPSLAISAGKKVLGLAFLTIRAR